MSSTALWRRSGSSVARRSLASRLRNPQEHAAVAACVISNVVLVAATVIVLRAEADLLRAYPFIEDELYALAIAAVLALPVTFVARRAGFFGRRGNGWHVTSESLPELHGLLLEQCKLLGLERVPDLYISCEAKRASIAYSLLDKRSVVVLSAELFDHDWKANLDCIAFSLGSALGSLLLGHTQWWVEMLTVFAIRIPVLRSPVLQAWTYSRDRCAAYVVPDGIRGLVIQAVGKDMLGNADVASFIEQSMSFGGKWARLASSARESPHLCDRVKTLYREEFFDLDRDLARWRKKSREAHD